MLAVHHLVPGLTMQQADPPRPPSAPGDKPLITGTPPQLIPMATVPHPQFFIGGSYLLPPIAPLTNINIDRNSFGGLTQLHSFGGLHRPITAIPYYSPTDIYQRGATSTTNTATPILPNHTTASLSTQTQPVANQDLPSPASSLPPSLPHLRANITTTTPSSSRHPGSASTVVEETGSTSRHVSPQTSLPNSLDLASPVRTASHPVSARNVSATTPEQTPQASMPHLITDSPSTSRENIPTDVKHEPATSEDSFPSCTRPKSADAIADESLAFSSGKNPYPINALIDAPTSLSHTSRTSSLSSSISSFRFGGSLNKLWASQLSLSNKVNMKSTGNLNTETATMPSLGNQYIALGGSLPELSLTSLTRLLPSSSGSDPANPHPSLFTLVHHPAPLYVYSSQQHLATPFINPNGSITFGSFLSTGSSLCNPQKGSTSSVREGSRSPDKPSEENRSAGAEVKREEDIKLARCHTNVTRSLQSATISTVSSSGGTPEVKLATYSPITAHMIPPHPHATLNRGMSVMALPTFGTLTQNVDGSLQSSPHAAQLGSSPLVPHVTPYSPLTSLVTSTVAPVTAHIAAATPTSLDISSKATPPSSHLSPPVASGIGHTPLSPMANGSVVDSKEGVHRQIGVPPPSDIYVGGPSMNGMRMHTELEGGAVLTPTSELQQLPHASGGPRDVKREKDRPYKCDHPGCERSFSFPAHLRSHIQQIHISYRPCKCEFPGCGKRFYTPQHLNVHRRVHTGERPFVCPYADCNKAFTTAGNLKNHIRTHTGERPYACKFEGCTKRFAEMSSLKKHELTHTGEKPYKCRVCGKAFSQAGSRNTHERKHNRSDEEEGGAGEGKISRRYRIKRVSAAPSATFESEQH